ncbi:ribosome-binding factor A [Candidatus Tenderia electrophaga]|jgi:ribosome-binding factor A|uniref:Ribosome-binding factor A n=1 Tax=Candidatus Tenderia electrophaga TaxID=1748243 RepID=A0A0S2TD16_9GAMM|nr:ribosome-binding factor A [Candidatus Tenderia electrophaga]
MPREFSRTKRVEAQIQRELAQLIQFELKDPRIGLVTVSGVEVSKDLAYAKVYVTALGDEQHSVDEMLAALNHAAGFLRRELGKHLTTRVTPQLNFIYDESVERGANLSALIDAALAPKDK